MDLGIRLFDSTEGAWLRLPQSFTVDELKETCLSKFGEDPVGFEELGPHITENSLSLIPPSLLARFSESFATKSFRVIPNNSSPSKTSMDPARHHPSDTPTSVEAWPADPLEQTTNQIRPPSPSTSDEVVDPGTFTILDAAGTRLEFDLECVEEFEAIAFVFSDVDLEELVQACFEGSQGGLLQADSFGQILASIQAKVEDSVSLSTAAWSLFDMLDSDDSGYVRVHAILSSLLLICNEPFDGRLRVSFSLSDPNMSGYLTQRQLSSFLKATLLLPISVTHVKTDLDQEELDSVLDWTCNVSSQKIFDICELQASRITFPEFEECLNRFPRLAPWLQLFRVVECSGVQNTYTEDEQIGVNHRLQDPMRPEGNQGPLAASYNHTSSLQNTNHAKPQSGPDSANGDGKLQPGLLIRTTSQSTLRDLEEDSLLAIFDKFNSEHPDLGLSLREFQLCMLHALQLYGLESSDNDQLMYHLSSLFIMFDANNSGYVTQEEFLDGVAVLSSGSILRKLRLCFRLFDRDRDGKVDIHDLQQFLANYNEFNVEDASAPLHVKQFFSVSRRGHMRITFAEFVSAYGLFVHSIPWFGALDIVISPEETEAAEFERLIKGLGEDDGSDDSDSQANADESELTEGLTTHADLIVEDVPVSPALTPLDTSTASHPDARRSLSHDAVAEIKLSSDCLIPVTLNDVANMQALVSSLKQVSVVDWLEQFNGDIHTSLYDLDEASFLQLMSDLVDDSNRKRAESTLRHIRRTYQRFAVDSALVGDLLTGMLLISPVKLVEKYGLAFMLHDNDQDGFLPVQQLENIVSSFLCITLSCASDQSLGHPAMLESPSAMRAKRQQATFRHILERAMLLKERVCSEVLQRMGFEADAIDHADEAHYISFNQFLDVFPHHPAVMSWIDIVNDLICGLSEVEVDTEEANHVRQSLPEDEPTDPKIKEAKEAGEENLTESPELPALPPPPSRRKRKPKHTKRDEAPAATDAPTPQSAVSGAADDGDDVNPIAVLKVAHSHLSAVSLKSLIDFAAEIAQFHCLTSAHYPMFVECVLSEVPDLDQQGSDFLHYFFLSLFKTFDPLGEGVIDVRELLCGLSFLCQCSTGSERPTDLCVNGDARTEKLLARAFMILDGDCDGVLELKDVQTLIQSFYRVIEASHLNVSDTADDATIVQREDQRNFTARQLSLELLNFNVDINNVQNVFRLSFGSFIQACRADPDIIPWIRVVTNLPL